MIIESVTQKGWGLWMTQQQRSDKKEQWWAGFSGYWLPANHKAMWNTSISYFDNCVSPRHGNIWSKINNSIAQSCLSRTPVYTPLILLETAQSASRYALLETNMTLITRHRTERVNWSYKYWFWYFYHVEIYVYIWRMRILSISHKKINV